MRVKNAHNCNQGQITIYFALMLLFIITCMAFVINVGMFVKAKINLQNAVDAAAFSGAAVQARQLSTVAYLNWEMRNNYKEWMFKYYVLGSMALSKTNPAYVKSKGQVDFRQKLGFREEDDTRGDFFNVPSVCINPVNAETNICEIYFVPGIPRFKPLGIAGVDETLAEFTNVVVDERSKDCINRSMLNFLTALNWVYGIGEANATSDLFKNAPKIAFNRPGAWIQAMELAMRIRNMEKIINVPPQAMISAQDVSRFYQRGQNPVYERAVKAFWSGYRNLENNNGEMKRSFKLSELRPQKVNVTKDSLGGLLIPEDTAKYYVDLHINTLNLIMFYTFFLPRSGRYGNATDGVKAEAACAGIKTAMPVPAFPFGFTKNPNILTYYAVKGEGDYIGMFNPFSGNTGIHMTAYAAAKPFGGRIGPALFQVDLENSRYLRARTQPPRSFPYISGLNPGSLSGSNISGLDRYLGYPIPSLQTGNKFWVLNPGEAFGGVPDQNALFGIPNLVYGIYNLAKQGGAADGGIQRISPNKMFEVSGSNTNSNIVIEERAGLYDANQYLAFRSNITTTSNVVGPTETDHAIYRVRAPTLYEAMNYMIPSFYEGSDSRSPSTPGLANPTGTDPMRPYNYLLPAPLWSDSGWMQENEPSYYQKETIQQIVRGFIEKISWSIEVYDKELRTIASDLRIESDKLGTGESRADGSSADNYKAAANMIHDGGAGPASCTSIAGKFYHLFLGPPCPNTAMLQDSVMASWQAREQGFNTRYVASLAPYNKFDNTPLNPPEEGSENMTNANSGIMMTYAPGPVYGATVDAIFAHPFFGEGGDDNFTTISDRNYYSTKFVSVGSLMMQGYDGQQSISGPSVFTTYSEKNSSFPGDMGAINFKNPLDPGDPGVGLILSKGSTKFPVRQ